MLLLAHWLCAVINAKQSHGLRKSKTNTRNHLYHSTYIVDFYPSISEDLLDKAIAWAKQFTQISDITIIKHARKSLLFHKNQTRSKRYFDVAMGSYHGAEICELIGLFILNSLQNLFGKDIGLYAVTTALQCSTPNLD